MKIAYVVSGMTLTFVVNEIEAHDQARWQILPLASCRPETLQGKSELVAKWCRRTVYRSTAFAQLRAVIRQAISHPLRFLKMCFWVIALVFHNKLEFAKAVYEIPSACQFAPACTSFGAEHLHVHFASRSLSLGIMIGMLTGLPISCTVHAFDIFARSPAALKPRLARCKFIAAISKFNIDHLRNECGPSVADLCQVVHCGIDLDRFKTIQRDIHPGNMICVSQLTPKKGLSLAVETCAKLKDRGITFTYNIVGDGPVREALEKQIQQLGLHDTVKLLGAQPNDRLVPLLGRACVFFMPCIQVPSGDMDGIPVAMMEAMACKVPVVSRAISGIPELVTDGKNGLLVQQEDPNSLADALSELLHDHDRIERFGAAARRHVQHSFDITRTAAELRTLMQT